MPTPTIPTQGCTLYILDDVTAPGSPAVVRVAAVKGITSLGGSASDIDISNLDSTRKEFAKGLQDGGSPSFDIVFDPNTAAHVLLHTLAAAGLDATKSWFFAFSDGTAAPTFDSTGLLAPTTRSGIVFDAYVKQFQIDASIDSVLMGKIQLKATGSDTLNVKA
jgi:tail tube protein